MLVDHTLSLKTKAAQSWSAKSRSVTPRAWSLKLPKHESRRHSCAGHLWGGRWASMLHSGGSFLTRQSFRLGHSLRWLRCRSSVCSPAMTASGSCQPQSAELVARSRGWTCGPTLALRDCKKEDAHPRLRYWWFVELGHPRNFLVINAPEKKSSLLRRENFQKGASVASSFCRRRKRGQ